MRKKLYETIEPTASDSHINTAYSMFMMAAILVSLIPLTMKAPSAFWQTAETVTTVIFCIDYVLRLVTADVKMQRGAVSFLLYPLTPMAIIDLLAIVPAFLPAAGSLRVLKVFRLLRTFKVFRAFKIFRYSKNVAIICNVIRKQRHALGAVATLAIGYIIVSALLMFTVEADTFDTFFDAVYWATVSLTTVGYGDLYPVSTIGRTVAMVSSVVGIAIVALPAGIITAGYMDEVSEGKENEH